MAEKDDPRFAGFVPIARFEDPTEARILAGALEAEGFDVLCPGNQLAALEFTLRRATGGAAVYVPAEDADEARAFVAAANPVNPEALKWRQHPKAISGIPFAAAAMIDPLVGFAMADARKRGSRRRKIVAYGLAALVVGSFAAWIVWALSAPPAYY